MQWRPRSWIWNLVCPKIFTSPYFVLFNRNPFSFASRRSISHICPSWFANRASARHVKWWECSLSGLWKTLPRMFRSIWTSTILGGARRGVQNCVPWCLTALNYKWATDWRSLTMCGSEQSGRDSRPARWNSNIPKDAVKQIKVPHAKTAGMHCDRQIIETLKAVVD